MDDTERLNPDQLRCWAERLFKLGEMLGHPQMDDQDGATMMKLACDMMLERAESLERLDAINRLKVFRN
jgi:hypothetical protein